jgi:virginiamycin B lyase
MRVSFRWIALLLLLAACGPHSTPSPFVPNVAAQRVKLGLHVFIPNRIGTHRAGRAHLDRRSRGVLHQLFIAANTAGMQVAVYPHGLRTGLVASITSNVSSSSPSCTTVSNGRTCSFAISVPPGGPYDFVLATFDEPPSGGVIPGGAAELGAATDTATIATGKANSLNVTVGGVVASTFIFASPADVFHAIASRSERLTIGARDADGNLIATDGYVDANGNQVTITPSADANAGDAIFFSPAKFSTPQSNGVILQYSSVLANSYQLLHGFDTTLSAATGTSATAGTLLVHVAPPQHIEAASTAAGPEEIVLALGAIFVTSAVGNALNEFFPGSTDALPVPNSAPNGITVDSTGNVVWAQTGTDALGTVVGAPGGGATTTYTAASLPTGTQPIRIGSGPDGAVWFSEFGTNAIGRATIAATGSATVTGSYPLPTLSAGPQQIVAGPDGALWFTECKVGKIGRIPVNATPGSSAQITEYALPNNTSHPFGIVAGPDGALWFTESLDTNIGRITTDGHVTEYPVPGGATAEIAVAPDGALWFTEEVASKIGRILTSATPADPGIVEYSTASASAQPIGITVAPDGTIYYVEYNKNAYVVMR